MLTDLQDEKAAAEHASAGAIGQKNVVETTIALATRGAWQQKLSLKLLAWHRCSER